MQSILTQPNLCGTDLSCGHCKEGHHCTFAELLPQRVRESLCKVKKITHLGKGDILFRSGEKPDGFWVVCKGQIKVSRLASDGKPLILNVVQAGDTVGTTPFFSQEAHEGSAEALEPSMVAFLQSDVVEELITFNSGFATSMLKQLAKEVSHAESKAVDMAYRSARDRVITVLAELHRHLLEHGDDGWSFSIPRRDLAEQAGLTVETIVRVLKSLEKEGLLFLKGRQIQILDRPLFSALMNTDN